jgi:hypothetical protein
MRTCVRVAGALLVAQSVAAAQQDATPAVESLRIRAHELAREAGLAATREREARVKADAIEGDTLRIDSLVIITRGEDAAVVRAGARLAHERVNRLVGRDAAAWVSDTIRVVFGAAPKGAWSANAWMLEESDAADVANMIVVRLRSVLVRDARVELRRWASFPLDKDSSALFREAHVELLSAAPGATTGCIEGSIAQCRIALGLTAPSDPLTAFWDSAGRYETVRRLGPGWKAPEIRPQKERCLRTREDASCTAFIRYALSTDPARWTVDLAPVGRAGRETLLLVAVRLGGRDALRTLHSDTGGAVGRIVETAAGQPIDSVVSAWRASVLEARPDEELARRSRLAALLWSLGFALVAIGGSAWRG